MESFLASAKRALLRCAAMLLLAIAGLATQLSAQSLDRLTTGRTYIIAFPDTSGNLYDIRHPPSIPSIKQVMIYSATESNRVAITNNATKQVLGAQLLSNYSSEFIVTVGTFIELGMTLDEIKKIVFPHPTVSEIIREAVFQY